MKIKIVTTTAIIDGTKHQAIRVSHPSLIEQWQIKSNNNNVVARESRQNKVIQVGRFNF
jgi:hypothetical protein